MGEQWGQGWIVHKEAKTLRTGTRCAEHARLCRYRTAYRGRDRKVVYGQTFRTANEAKGYLTTWVADIKDGRAPDPKLGRKSLQRAYDDMLAARDYAAATKTVYADAWKHVPESIRERGLAEVSRGDVDKILSDVPTPAMRAKLQSVLSSTFNHAGFAPNPATRAKRKPTRAEKMQRDATATKKRHYLSDQDLVALLAKTPPRYRALVELMARMGLRPGEAFAIKVGKFDSLKSTLLIDEAAAGPTKTGEPRQLVLPAVVSEMLTEHIERYSDAKDPAALMFPADKGAMIDANNWRRRVFDVAVTDAGLSDLTPNSLRHSAVSFAIANGATVYDVQRMVGHAQPSITLNTYGELWDSSQERLAEVLDPAIRKAQKAKPTNAEVIELHASQA